MCQRGRAALAEDRNERRLPQREQRPAFPNRPFLIVEFALMRSETVPSPSAAHRHLKPAEYLAAELQLDGEDSYSPGVAPSPVKGPASAGPTPGPAVESLPAHSGSVVVSYVHRPPEEAFHSCFGARNTLIAASERARDPRRDRPGLSTRRV